MTKYLPRVTMIVSMAGVTLMALVMGAGTPAEAANPSSESAPSAATRTPGIHGRQVTVTVKDGEPVLEQMYRHQLKLCMKTRLDVQPLKEAVARKLGRTMYEFWIKGDRAAARSSSWGFKIGDGAAACTFHPVHSIRRSISGPEGTYHINVNEGIATYDPEPAYVPQPPRKSQRQDKSNHPNKAKVMEQLKKHGYGDIAKTIASRKHSAAIVAGQPCIRTQARSNGEGGELCVWSGGEQWGFYGSALDGYLTVSNVTLTYVAQVMVPGDNILLQKHPAGGTGLRLTTELFTVGKPFAEEHVFDLPHGVTVSGK